MSGVSEPVRLKDLIKEAISRGLTYEQIAARTRKYEHGSVSRGKIHDLATEGTPPGKVPLTRPQLQALASAIEKPWEVVKHAVLEEADMAEVASFDGASIVVAKAREELRDGELEVWTEMAEELIRLVRQRRARGR